MSKFEPFVRPHAWIEAFFPFVSPIMHDRRWIPLLTVHNSPIAIKVDRQKVFPGLWRGTCWLRLAAFALLSLLAGLIASHRTASSTQNAIVVAVMGATLGLIFLGIANAALR